jgi:hypothetical protein
VNLFGAGSDTAGGAGTFAVLGFVNPAASGRLIVVERVQYAAADITPSRGLAHLRMDLATNIDALTPTVLAVNQGPRDSRLIVPGGGQGSAVMRLGNPGAAPTGFLIGEAEAALGGFDPPTVTRDIVLFPGFGLSLNSALVGGNQRIMWSIEYYERETEIEEQTS